MAHHQRSLWKGVLMGKIIAVGNLKGGTGKSTIAVNLACGLAERTGAVALIDADPQGTATAWLRDGPPQGLHLLSLPLAGAAGNAPWTDRIVGQRRRQDLVVLDLPPQMGECFEAALRIADLLVIPLTLSEVDLHATAQALAVLHRVQAARRGPPSCLLVPSKVDRRTSVGRQARAALVRLGWQVGPALGQRAAHSDALQGRQVDRRACARHRRAPGGARARPGGGRPTCPLPGTRRSIRARLRGRRGGHATGSRARVPSGRPASDRRILPRSDGSDAFEAAARRAAGFSLTKAISR
jgi:chromosome partitioning protein